MNDAFTWIDGRSVQKSFWNLGEPNDVLENEDCIEFLLKGLNDLSCSRERKFICEMTGNNLYIHR